MKGYLLIAPPKASDHRFANSVIFICAHTAAGAWGLVINRPVINVPIRNVFKRLGFENSVEGTVHDGGPVDQNGLHIVHSTELSVPATHFVTDELAVSSDLHLVDSMSNGYIPNKFRACAGACTWAPNQLDGEMEGKAPWRKEHRWLYTPATPELVFGYEGIEQWRMCLDQSAAHATKDWLM